MCMAGLGGMLFDLGGTIINPAIPYLESLKSFSTAELSHLTSAVVLSAAFAGLVAGPLAERFGRRTTMLFAASIAFIACLPICLGGGSYRLFYLGRLMQGVAAGLLGVVVPMYLARHFRPTCAEALRQYDGRVADFGRFPRLGRGERIRDGPVLARRVGVCLPAGGAFRPA